MDLLRSAIKCLLYDWPIEPVAEYVFDPYSTSQNIAEYYDRFTELMKWREKSFTASETRLLSQILKDEWVKDEDPYYTAMDNYHPYEKVMMCVKRGANVLLNITGADPNVRFRHLLRWRDLTLLTDEDTLILSALAYFDTKNNIENRNLLWNRPLGHDNIKINTILKEELTDTHAHLNASTEVFEINWLIAMNNPEYLVKTSNKNNRYFTGALRDYDPIRRYSSVNFTLAEWMVIAAWIRKEIFCFLFPENGNFKEISILKNKPENPEDILELAKSVKKDIAILTREAAITTSGEPIDYTFRKSDANNLHDIGRLHYPSTLLYGERNLIYTALNKFFYISSGSGYLAAVLYLYLLIKNKFRRELIQTNQFKGFQNFKDYQDNKFIFNSLMNHNMEQVALRYAVQSSMFNYPKRYFEARVVAGQLASIRNSSLEKPIFPVEYDIKDTGKGWEISHLSLIAHFIKTKESQKKVGQFRYEKLRNSLHLDLKQIVDEIKRNNEYDIKVTGIDAAGVEINCPPEVFSEVYDKARKMGLRNLTYHVGEDFYDILHGIRMIDNTLHFLEFSDGCRIGHGLALGLDAKKYYSERHYVTIIPKQELLDNVVWLKFKAMEYNIHLQPSTELFIEREYYNLRDEIGYPTEPPFEYWKSMLNRNRTNREEIKNDRILSYYLEDDDVFNKGKIFKSCKLPENFDKDIKELQNHILCEIIKKRVTIETNPTSNFHIGGFGRYDSLPLLKFHSVGDEGFKTTVSINTDDKGIFSTSLENEFSLIALALLKFKDSNGKHKWNEKQVEDYLRRIAHYNNITRFTPPELP